MTSIVFRVDSSEPEEMLGKLAQALRPPNITNAVRDGAQVLLVGIRARAPRKTGRLATSFSIRPVSAYEYTVQSDLIYAPVHEYGAVIKPRNGTYLRFTVGSKVVFTKGPVVIPKRPYVAPTFTSDGGKALDAVADRIIAGLG